MEKTMEQLKVEAYDLLAAIEYHQGKLREINQLIVQKSQEKTQDESDKVQPES